MTKELQVVRKRKGEMTLTQTMELGTIFAASGMFTDVQSKAQAVVKILAGRELGIPDIVAMSQIAVINGKIGIPGELMADLIKRSGKYDYRITQKTWTDKFCEITFYEKINGKMEEIGKSSYSIEEAQKVMISEKNGVKLLLSNKENWKNRPKTHLCWTALKNGARFYCADALHGACLTEELIDITPTENGGIEEKINQAQATTDAEILIQDGNTLITPEAPLKQHPTPPEQTNKLTTQQKINEMVFLAKELPGTDADKELIMSVFFEQLNLRKDTPFEKLTTEQINKLIGMIKNNTQANNPQPGEPPAEKKEKKATCPAGFCYDCFQKGVKKELTKSQIKLSEKNFEGAQLCYKCQAERNK